MQHPRGFQNSTRAFTLNFVGFQVFALPHESFAFPLISFLCVGILGLIVTGCVAPRQDLHTISKGLEQRSGYGLGETNRAEGQLPADITLADGLTEDEAVTVALSNNPAFRGLLPDLGLGARG